MNERAMRIREPSGFEDDYLDEIDDVGEGYSGPTGPLSRPPRANDILPAVIFMFFCLAGTLLFQSPYRDLLWVSGESVFSKQEYWRPATALFAHSNMMHLISNSFILVGFGWMLRTYFGLILFPVAGILAGVITNVAAVSIYEPDVRMLGASGMAHAMVSLWLIFYIRYDTDRPVLMRIFRAVGFSLVMLVPTVIEPNVSYLAHGLGFVVGAVIGIFLLNRVTVISESEKEDVYRDYH